MKHILSIIVMTLLIAMSSCKKSFIEKDPISAATTDAVYKTDKDFKDAVVGTYQAFKVQYANMWQFGDLRGDDAFIQISNQPSSTGVDVFSINSSDILLRNTWANYYIAINRANMVITKLETADAGLVPNKDIYMGEAKFLRALAYFDMVRIFGDVQLITGLPSVEQIATTPRSPVATVYNDLIIKDLQDAVAKLPLTWGGVDVGRATRGAAKAILGKVYLTVKDFANAENTLRELTAAPYSYTLLANYNDLFDYSKDEHHREYIFDIEYESGGGDLGSNFTNAFLPNVPALLDYYSIRGGFGESLSPTQKFIALWQAGDKRKDITFQCCGSWRNPTTGAVVNFIPTTSQSFTQKYITAVAILNDSKANWKVVRYADVLLMYAEALNENGKTDLALAPLNQVRVRAGLPAYANLTQTAARDNIALERRFELAFEGHRWFDLVRTGKALTELSAVGMQPYMTVFPVPLSEIKVINNPSVFPQNPGYN